MKALSALLATVVILCLASDAEAGRKRKRRGGCGSAPASLRGGEETQKRHNRAATDDDLSRLESRDDLVRFIDAGLLVPIEDTSSYYLDTVGGHDAKHANLYRHARPWTKRFLDREMAALRDAAGIRAKITSLVRTDAYQEKICRAGNGAAICGDAWWEQSLHLTGATVDVSKLGMSCEALTWMRKRLIRLQEQGLVAAIEERGAFHVFVRKAYGSEPKKAKKRGKKAKRTGRDRRRTR